MPLTKLQSHVLRILAAERSPDGYIAGGVAINREGPHFSGDIDIFPDTEQRLEAAALADGKALTDAGLKLTWKKIITGKRDAEVEGLGDRMRLEWVHDCAFRFFPAKQDEIFGYVLHPVDLATNKTSAAADRREPRDIVDLVTIHETIFPLGAAICAAVGRFPGQSPEEMLADIRRHSRFTAEEFRVLATERPIDVPDLHHRIRSMLEDAEHFITRFRAMPWALSFSKAGNPSSLIWTRSKNTNVAPERQAACGHPHPEISSAMLERYKKQNGNGHEPKP